MSDFFFRTEDLRPEEVLKYFVETAQDRNTINAIKNRNPTIVVGSRGVGKSFLLRVAQQELMDSFSSDRVFPIYISFVRSSLVQSQNEDQFRYWMLSKICSAATRALTRAGMLSVQTTASKMLSGETSIESSELSPIEKVADSFENSWKNSDQIDVSAVPTIDDLKVAFEDLAEELNVKRFVLLIDEAAHIFLPEQQRQFFTLFRDLRSHCITCNAAVYPGVTSFGETFQPVHDATMISIDRDVLSQSYVDNMREIVERQAESALLRNIATNGKNFATLAYAASGNPRILLKTLAAAPRVNSTELTTVLRDYYRTDIWAEHSTLSEKYSGHVQVIDWGRSFIENVVLPEIKSKNDSYLASDKATSAYFWLHRDAPASVKEALRILSYTGIVNEQASGIKASRGEVGTRYMVNLGCLFSLESTPTATAFEIADELTPKRMTEYGANHTAYRAVLNYVGNVLEEDSSHSLKEQMAKPIDVLDLTLWQKEKLVELELLTVGQVLGATEAKLKEAQYVGDVRARRMRNAAVAAVLEYLSG